MIYFTADTHFDHGNIIRFCNRPFATVEKMNETLISNWNRKVHANDTVFIMGDMFFRTTDPEPILQRLKGKKHLIVGNHDSQWMKKVDMGRWFESVQSYLETSDGQHTMTMCHFPMVTWNHQSRSYMIHGHIHENTNMDYWPLIARSRHMLNAGVDINGFAPVTFEEMQQNNLEHIARTAAKRILEENRDTFAFISQVHQMLPELIEDVPYD